MTVFIDTSAFYAILDRDDANHASAGDTWLRLLRDEHTLLTTNYVLLETCALLQNRLGIPALRAFHQDVVPLLQIDWVSEERHNSGVQAWSIASHFRPCEKTASKPHSVSIATTRNRDSPFGHKSVLLYLHLLS
jgi:uncharacterized protein